MFSTVIASAYVGVVAADEPGVDELRRNHVAYQSWKQQNDSQAPFFLETTRREDTFSARMGVETEIRSLTEFAAIVRQPRAWCEFMPLHLNVKACIAVENSGNRQIKLYFGKKHYQRLKKTKLLTLDFDSSHSPDFVSTKLYAKSGPYGTSDYHIELYAIPTTAGVYSELRVSQRFGKMAKRLGKLYLATIGRNKEGFTILGHDRDGEPHYVRGMRGVVERNIARYLLAIKVFLETQALTGRDAFQRRAELWFDATEAYKRQLHELSRREYLDAVRREYDNQLALQQTM